MASGAAGSLLLILLAGHWSLTVQVYQEAVEMLDELSPTDVQTANPAEENLLPTSAAVTDKDPKSADFMSNLWLDISDAFRFLEKSSVDPAQRQKLFQDGIKGLRLKDKNKSLPFNQHSFVRFGKRFSLNPNTMNILSHDKESSEKDMEGTFHNFKRLGKKSIPSSLNEKFNWQEDIYDNEERPKRQHNPIFNGLRNAVDLDASVSKRQTNSAPSGQPNEVQETVKNNSLATGNNNSNHANNFVRPDPSTLQEGSVPNMKDSTDTMSSLLKMGDNLLLFLPPALNTPRHYLTARIGRLPASVFYKTEQGKTDENKRPASRKHSRSFPMAFQDMNSLPRYG